MSRRAVLAGAGGAAAVALAYGVLGPWVLTGGAARARNLTLAGFTPLVGSWFEVRAGGSGAERVPRLQLVEAVAITPSAQGGRPLRGEAFSLLFGGVPVDAELHGVVTLHHGRTGSFPLFVAPVGRRTSGSQVEAVVNRARLGR